ncbi:hypothetical protein [Fusibacter ferrireducens]|uniref:L-2-amino-thiazoline-4-carboxylic acid hydrolase n=1 Tax=Fusibacter ferrireducens TaxID=2785058 RepID=A0ABR9ZVV5_9FIRM|nr:hypothetical protein [Fusibacter ferrireducens]MBF4694476.1 hypothetical protein [Fusibacter ferrireducens]
MHEKKLRAYYSKRGISETDTDLAVDAVKALETYLTSKKMSFETAKLDAIRVYIDSMVSLEISTPEDLLAMARYFYIEGHNEIYIYFTSLLGGIGVIEHINDRLIDRAGPYMAHQIMGSVQKPRIGSEPKAYPSYTGKLMNALENQLPIKTVQEVLAGNNHGISKTAYLKEKEIYESFDNMDLYLADLQKRKIEELQEHCDENKVWYEQKITQEVVDFAAKNQEIMSAVREGNILYSTKIPYNPEKYLETEDSLLKRYYACHCPFARESILSGEAISENWCYCSGGFAKFPYEVILDRPLRVELLESVLKGDSTCRFAIYLEDSNCENNTTKKL